MSSIKPCDRGSEIDGIEEVGSTFIMAGGDGTELLEPVEKFINQTPCSVEIFIALAWGYFVD